MITRNIEIFPLNKEDQINEFIRNPDIKPISIAVSNDLMYILYEAEEYSEDEQYSQS